MLSDDRSQAAFEKLNSCDDKERFAVGANDQEVVALEPVVETVESVSATLRFAT